MVIEQVKTLPEQLLSSVSAFIKLLEAEQTEMSVAKTASNYYVKTKWPRSSISRRNDRISCHKI